MIHEVDWTSSMQQTFSFYKVDPRTWRDLERIDTMISAQIVRDLSDETLGYATFDADGISGEFYVRTYLDVTQNRRFYHIPLGTHLIQSTDDGYNGRRSTITVDGYTPLMELKEKTPPIGFFFGEGENILDSTKDWLKQLMRAPLLDWRTAVSNDVTVKDQNGFVAELDETWLEYLTAFLKNCDHSFRLTEKGEVYLDTDKPSETLQPVFVYQDDRNSILHPQIKINRDLYSIPNVVELLISKPEEDGVLVRATNENPNSPISIQSRGREVVQRITDPDVTGYNTLEQYQELAEKTLDDLSNVEYEIEYTHGFNPVKVGDCVEINYERAGLKNIRARVIRQTIECRPGCKVEEMASYTTNLRR